MVHWALISRQWRRRPGGLRALVRLFHNFGATIAERGPAQEALLLDDISHMTGKRASILDSSIPLLLLVPRASYFFSTHLLFFSTSPRFPAISNSYVCSNFFVPILRALVQGRIKRENQIAMPLTDNTVSSDV